MSTDPHDLEALFTKMEAAAAQADSTAELDAAIRLCELRSEDPRAEIAAARVIDLAENTSTFHAVAPKIRAAIEAGSPQASYLRMALLEAVADGMPGASVKDLAHAAGIITAWRLAGPFGRYPNLDFDRRWPPEDGLSQAAYAGRAVESFEFDDGSFLLPDYAPASGIYYAAGSIELGAGEWVLRAETLGTAQIFVDGKLALTQDNRFHQTATTASKKLQIGAGTHDVLVKFLASATPFRVSFIPARAPGGAALPIAHPAETAYVRAALAYWAGNYEQAISDLDRQKDAISKLLLAEAWDHAAPGSSAQRMALQEARKLAPSMLAADYELAKLAYDEDQDQSQNEAQNEEAWEMVTRVTAARPSFAPAQQLRAELAIRLHEQAEAIAAVEAETGLHPSCGALKRAAEVFASISGYERVHQYEKQLENCAPGSLAYAGALSESGHHAEAAAAAARVAALRPLDRDAHAMLTRELALAGDAAGARRAAEKLKRLAPNSERLQRLAEQAASGARVLDPESARGGEFDAAQTFYAPYRREAMQVIHDTAERRFSGGPAVTLLQDHVVRLQPNGDVSLYVHKLTRLLNRDGIERYGEVRLPPSAEVLELRTIKRDGTIAEPELTTVKATTSMPALAPGDVIEQEYVVRYPGQGLSASANAFGFTFGSFTAPILFTRFVAITPLQDDGAVRIATFGEVPKPAAREENGARVRVWEKNDIPQSVEEIAMPPASETLPMVRLLPMRDWADVRDEYRNALIEATRIGPRVAAVAREIAASTGPRSASAGTDEEQARVLYHYVTSHVRSTEATMAQAEITSAEDTLAGWQGSRTAVLIALARASGLSADLVLARRAGTRKPDAASDDVYIDPLVRFHLRNGPQKDVIASAEKDGVGLGALPAAIAREDALAVPFDAPEAAAKLFVSLPSPVVDERSTADGDVTIDEQGNLAARLVIRMGAARSTQLRAILNGIEPRGRGHFFEQLALRIFPGISEASGEVHNEGDSDQPLELVLACRAPHFLNFVGDVADMDQLVPALGLRKMYGTGGVRQQPLLLDVPLIETTKFRVRLA
ncbi:MAG TPA: DUF3857 domain-containing protein, partial [Bryobacteraceae bacterium]